MVLNIATLFFLRETGGPGEKPSYLCPSDHQFSDVFFFDLFSYFNFPLIFFFRLFPFSYFLYSLLPHITSKMPMLQYETVNISDIILHHHFVGVFFRFRHRHFLFSTIRYGMFCFSDFRHRYLMFFFRDPIIPIA